MATQNITNKTEAAVLSDEARLLVTQDDGGVNSLRRVPYSVLRNKLLTAAEARLDALEATAREYEKHAIAAKRISDYHDRRIKYLEMLSEGRDWNWEEQSVDGTETVVPKGAYAGSVKTLGGRSLVMRQLQRNTSNRTNNGVRFEFNAADGTLTISEATAGETRTATAYWLTSTANKHTYVEGHKYLFRGMNGIAWDGATVGINGQITVGGGEKIVECVEGGEHYISINIRSSVDLSTPIVIRPEGFDLTEMFGAGSEPSVEEFNDMFPDYIPLIEPVIVSANVDKYVVNGANLLDPNNKTTTYFNTNGLNETTTSSGLLSYWLYVKPNTDYRITKTRTSDRFTVFGINELGSKKPAERFYKQNTGLTTVVNSGNWSRLGIQVTLGAVGDFPDVIVSEGTEQIEYVPYRESVEINLPESVLALDGYGLGVNDVYNELDIENSVYIKRVNRVDLGTLDWGVVSVTTPSGDGNSFNTTINNIVKPTSDGEIINAVIAGYTTTKNNAMRNAISNGNNAMFSARVAGGSTTGIWLYNSTYDSMNKGAVKTALSGTYLYYQLAKPVITPLADLLPADDIAALKESFDAEGGGKIVFHTSGVVQIPCRANLEYAVKVGEAV